ncbi:hypothetical protein OCAR_7612 [Afipia carboxidovorans OM5]|nr:hypothetical protein OCAR_7612 [Afipia carboxidovorans OM5]
MIVDCNSIGQDLLDLRISTSAFDGFGDFVGRGKNHRCTIAHRAPQA